jgi:magnesium chelatase family protein
VARYRQRLSGPLIDRFDLVVKVDRLEASALHEPGETTKTVGDRVAKARSFLATADHVLLPDADHLLTRALEIGLLTARGADRVRRVATTIAALGESAEVGEEHVAEAMASRVAW